MVTVSLQTPLRRQKRRAIATIYISAILLLALFAAIVEGFVVVSRNPSHHVMCASSNDDDVDVVGEGRRGDAKGAALRLVDVAVSRGGSTLLSNIDWRVEPKSKWGLVVGTQNQE